MYQPKKRKKKASGEIEERRKKRRKRKKARKKSNDRDKISHDWIRKLRKNGEKAAGKSAENRPEKQSRSGRGRPGGSRKGVFPSSAA